jgi:hypothetical protein
MAAGRMLLLKRETAHLVAAGAAAVFAAAALGAEPSSSLEDVQIGERGEMLRVALICSDRCEVVPGDGLDFRINGVAAELDVDLAARSALAERLTIAPASGGSIVHLVSEGRIDEARVITCQSDSGLAPCLEYRIAASPRGAGPSAPAAAHPKATAPALRADEPTPAEARPDKAADDLPFIGAVILAPQPTLRDEPAAGILYLPRFQPPERLSPPSRDENADDSGRKSSADAHETSKVLGALSGKIEVGRPSLVAVDRAATLGKGAVFDLKSEATEILGKSFSVGVCEGAKARLMGDAWALDAMIDLAFCKAADGNLEEADADFARLLNYTPDNYQALVGRGLIALAQGDRDKGLELYQEALNALPPIAESDRIVAAMERN